MDKIKEIMRASFHKEFYIDKTYENNFEYLDSLVDLAVAECNTTEVEKIANLICIYDERLKNIFSLNLEFVSRCYDDIIFSELSGAESLDTCFLDIDEISNLFRCSISKEIFQNRYKIALIVKYFDELSARTRNNFLECVEKYLERELDISLKNISVYRVKLMTNVRYCIGLNELACWYTSKKGIPFSYQIVGVVELLGEFEKNRMFNELSKALGSRKISEFKLLNVGNVFDKIICVNEPIYTDNVEYGYIYDGIGSAERQYINTIIELQKNVINCIYKLSVLHAENNLRLMKSSSKITALKLEINNANKTINSLHRSIEVERKKHNEELKKIEEKVRLIQNELVSLRSYVFENGNIEKYSSDKLVNAVDSKIDNYECVVVIGGHTKWQKKISNYMNRIVLIHTDQNVVDWSFLLHIKLVVIVIDYISHSMYNRVMEHIDGQKIMYVNYRNLENFRGEVDERLSDLLSN